MHKSLVVGSLVALLAGSGGIGFTNPVHAESTSNQVQPSPSSSPAAQPPASLELLNPGAEPRQLIRYALPEQLTQTATITTQGDVTVTLAEQPSSMALPIPAIATTMNVESNRVNDQGDTRVEFVYSAVTVEDNVTLPNEMEDLLRSQLQSLVGLRGTYVINSQGQLLDSQLNLPANANPQMEAMFNQLMNSVIQSASYPFPDVPVGQGAKWRTQMSLPGALPINADMTYEVTELRENAVAFNIAVASQLTPQSSLDLSAFGIPATMIPPGFRMDVRSLDVQGSGTLDLRLDRVMPEQARITTISNIACEVTTPDNQKFSMTIRSNAIMNLGSQSN